MKTFLPDISAITGNFKNFKYQLGTRVENTNLKINSLSLNRQYTFNYTDFFPSANIIYNINGNSIGFDFSRKIIRPDYNMLNPFLNTANPTYYLQGNPFLKPAYIYQFQAKYIKNWNNDNMNIVSVFSSITNNLFASVVLNDTANILLETGANYLSYKSFGLQMSSQNKINDWLNLSSNATIINVSYKSNIPQTGNFPTSTYLSANVNANILVNKEPLFRISGNLITEHRYGQFTFKNTGGLDLSINKKIIGDKFSASLTLTDVFNTQNNTIVIYNPSYNSIMKTKPITRYLYLSLKYSFGKDTKKSKQSNNQLEENNRAKNL